jgi:hypothetical protein
MCSYILLFITQEQNIYDEAPPSKTAPKLQDRFIAMIQCF